eukprot:Nitzschia sp. Nitz4//scaffold179_size51476//11185//12093//NITZ4_006922-RA/size51476-processed-gene-0.47-mRNA-1//-1//CDS//3329539204//6581//frame0
MFSANENLVLRQHKRRIVDYVESTIPESALDLGTTVMVMQVTCQSPGCVPLETAIIIVFPKSSTEVIPGLPESQGGNYKTKILKPMADVTDDDILDALPPAFEGGRRTMERVCMYARDVMLGQITQLLGDDTESSVEERRAMAEYLQACLQDYIANDCRPPELMEPFPSASPAADASNPEETPPEPSGVAAAATSSGESSLPVPVEEGQPIPSSGNLVIRRAPTNNNSPTGGGISSTSTPPSVISHVGGVGRQERRLNSSLQQGSRISALFAREHAPGIRQAGCPCCDPENPSNVVDNMMMY